MNKKEQITIYENDNIYSYVKTNGTICTNTIEKNQTNINDYVKYIDDNNLFSIINLINSFKHIFLTSSSSNFSIFPLS